MPSYFDASAFVKLLLAEEGTEEAVAVWGAAERVVTSRLTYPEVRSAVASAHRDGRIPRGRLASVKRGLANLWDQVFAVDLSEPVADVAGELSERFALSGADAVQLATAIASAEGDLVFVTWDRKLATAAHALGLGVAPAMGSGSVQTDRLPTAPAFPRL